MLKTVDKACKNAGPNTGHIPIQIQLKTPIEYVCIGDDSSEEEILFKTNNAKEALLFENLVNRCNACHTVTELTEFLEFLAMIVQTKPEHRAQLHK